MPKNSWDLEIKPKKGWLDLNFKELIQYKDLLFLFVKRDVVVVYKQTILGPLWFFIQPILTTLIFTFVFGNIAKIPTDGIPPILFYLSGIVLWNYFAECFNQTSDTFIQNASIFGKVYFPRLILPLSKVISGLIKFFIQFLLLIAVYLFYLNQGCLIQMQASILLFPVLIILMAGIGLGLGLIFTALTTKYRDLRFLIQFGVQLLMYATPVIYSLQSLPEKYRSWIALNPLSHLIEIFRNGLLGTGRLDLSGLLYTTLFTSIILLAGMIIFNRNEKSFMDTV